MLRVHVHGHMGKATHTHTQPRVSHPSLGPATAVVQWGATVTRDCAYPRVIIPKSTGNMRVHISDGGLIVSWVHSQLT